jgi:hypothetical protein
MEFLFMFFALFSRIDFGEISRDRSEINRCSTVNGPIGVVNGPIG